MAVTLNSAHTPQSPTFMIIGDRRQPGTGVESVS